MRRRHRGAAAKQNGVFRADRIARIDRLRGDPPMMSPYQLALRQAFGAPGIALSSSFFALGVLFAESGYSPAQGVAFTIFTFALPGQLVAAEMFGHGAGLAAIALAVLLVNARLLPLVVSLLPLLRAAKPPRAGLYCAAHLIAVTGWVCFMNGHRRVAAAARWRYFLVLAVLLWTTAAAATALGGFAATALPRPLALGLLFLNPAYFLCMIISGMTEKAHVAALISGVVLFVPCYAISPDGALIVAGVIGGTFAYLAGERRSAEERQSADGR